MEITYFCVNQMIVKSSFKEKEISFLSQIALSLTKV